MGLQMSTTYLQLVNDVLVRLREPTVTNVNENDYSALVSKLIVDAKREVEDAWNWDVLRTTYSITTTAGVFNYTLTGAGTRFRVIQAANDTDDSFMEYRPAAYMTQNLILSGTPQQGIPQYYNFNGVDTNGDSQVDIYPIPNDVYTLRFDVVKPEAELSANSDTTELPKNPIVLLAWAKAIEERGEDGGIGISSQYAVAKQSLADHVAIEAGRRPDETNWYWV
jgi:hypothetical protein